MEDALRWHPEVRDCVVVRMAVGPSDHVVAYVETRGFVDANELRRLLPLNWPRSSQSRTAWRPRTAEEALPTAVVILGSLPRTPAGGADIAALPLPVVREPYLRVAKGGRREWITPEPVWRSLGGSSTDEEPPGCFGLLVFVAFIATLLTNAFWPGSTDVSGVPGPWAGLFIGLYVAEGLSFLIGVAFLIYGGRAMARFHRPRGWTRAARLAIVWLLVAWWPQDNFYRLTAKTDWRRQAALVYGFNITLMLAAATLVAFAVSRRRRPGGWPMQGTDSRPDGAARRADGWEPFPGLEHALRWHPDVRDCAVIGLTEGRQEVVVAYAETCGYASPHELRSFLQSSQRRSRPRREHVRLPDAVMILDTLPRTTAGDIDVEALPRPAIPDQVDGSGGKASGGKAWGGTPDKGNSFLGVMLSFGAFLLAALTTDVFWPGSTDLSGVPGPWAGLFRGLYAAEMLSFAVGVAFLTVGSRAMARFQRAPGWTLAARLAIVWLLVAWWPQDNFYRLASKTDWPRQAALVYGFNITLMVAAVILVSFAGLAPVATSAVRRRLGSGT
jgi:hypothetical protein